MKWHWCMFSQWDLLSWFLTYENICGLSRTLHMALCEYAKYAGMSNLSLAFWNIFLWSLLWNICSPLLFVASGRHIEVVAASGRDILGGSSHELWLECVISFAHFWNIERIFLVLQLLKEGIISGILDALWLECPISLAHLWNICGLQKVLVDSCSVWVSILNL